MGDFSKIQNTIFKDYSHTTWLLFSCFHSYVHFKSLLLYDWYMLIEFHPLMNILIQIDNLNP